MTSVEPGFDPLELSERVEKLVVRGDERKYYRFRATRFYGGCVTGDVVGCNLRCVFCWTGRPRDDYSVGEYYSPEEAWRRLERLAVSRGIWKVRLSGGEPTIGFNHLLKLLELAESRGKYLFILETNGVLIGARKEYARALSRFTRVHVRVSIKACSKEWFYKLTGARPSSFQLQLKALENLADYNVSYHPAVVVSFGDNACHSRLVEEIGRIDPEAVGRIEWEIITLYPHVAERLRRRGLWPREDLYYKV